MINITDIKFDKYKSFDNENFISNIKNVNVFIGKNNSGKSSCLDVIEYIFRNVSINRNKAENIRISHKLNDELIKTVFPLNSSISGIGGAYRYAKKYNNSSMWFSIEKQNSTYGIKNNVSYLHELNNFDYGRELASQWSRIAEHIMSDLSNVKIFKISAERNIYPEDGSVDQVYSTGEGVTTKIANYINDSAKDEKVIEEILLAELNKIVFPDSLYTNIKVQQFKDGENYKWEIYLTENGNRYALSKMGSGLKTIIMVLLNLIVLKKEVNNKCIYLFEELENNLHPSLQRRLFNYIYECAEKENLTIFITTHSHVAINSFYDKEKAHIYHIEKSENKSYIHEVNNYFDKAAILDDLDVKASDLFQSNGIVWVEGPSDRIYIKKWLELKDSSIIENVHYQFAYYGGKNLFHYTTEENENNLINVLLTNRNSAIVIDSDKRARGSKINATKLRIQKEFNEKKLLCWITQGKEIENYITKKDINQLFSVSKENIGLYELFPDYIKNEEPNFATKKVEFSKKITQIMDVNSLGIYNLDEMIKELIRQIKKWNGIV